MRKSHEHDYPLGMSHIAMENHLRNSGFIPLTESVTEILENYTRCSMYRIFTYIWVIISANVSKYSSAMEHMGI